LARERPILVGDHQGTVRIQHLRTGKAAFAPQLGAGLGVESDHEGRPEITARAHDRASGADGPNACL